MFSYKALCLFNWMGRKKELYNFDMMPMIRFNEQLCPYSVVVFIPKLI